MNQQEWTKQLQQEGFSDIGICPNRPNEDFGEHTHDQQTVHIIMQGSLIVTDEHGKKIYHEGDRLDVPAGTTHTAKSGSVGCTFLVGVKEE